MREYETIYVLKPDLPAEQFIKIKEKVEETLKKGEGHIISHTDWGKRRLAYQVDKFRFAQYIYLQYLDQGGSVSELERILKYDDSVLKFLTVKLNDKVVVEERLAKKQEPLPPPEEIMSSRSGDYVRSRREVVDASQEKEKKSEGKGPDSEEIMVEEELEIVEENTDLEDE